jgi:hypothetical protein
MATITQQNDIASERDVFSFTLRIGGDGGLTDAMHDALAAVGCDDALLRQCDGHIFLDFDREDKSMTDAIVSAIIAVESSAANLTVLEVIPPGSREIKSINAVLRARRETGLVKSLEKPQH